MIVRLALRSATHGEPDENAFHPLPEEAVGLKAARAFRIVAEERDARP
jgi:hypothetical protein